MISDIKFALGGSFADPIKLSSYYEVSVSLIHYLTNIKTLFEVEQENLTWKCACLRTRATAAIKSAKTLRGPPLLPHNRIPSWSPYFGSIRNSKLLLIKLRSVIRDHFTALSRQPVFMHSVGRLHLRGRRRRRRYHAAPIWVPCHHQTDDGRRASERQAASTAASIFGIRFMSPNGHCKMNASLFRRVRFRGREQGRERETEDSGFGLVGLIGSKENTINCF